MSNRNEIAEARRWVVKIGSALLTNDGRGLDKKAMSAWVAQLAALRQRGVEVVLVSSGSVAEGVSRLGWKARPDAIHQLQAAAAVGQMGLVQAYESAFQLYGLHTAQILLVHDDLSHRQRYLNARSTLQTLLKLGVIPVVNENDTVATDEIRFGDNDTLAALVANLVDAHLLVILTDQQGLFNADPRSKPDAELISDGQADDPRLLDYAGAGSGRLGRGGMLTKVRAGKLAARSGAHTLIASGREEDVLLKIADQQPVGTFLRASQAPQAARKQWLAGHLRTKGSLTLDEGAARMISKGGKSLLPVGVTAVSGHFQRGEVVSCVDTQGAELARGLVNYSAEDARKILRVPSSGLAQVLGYQGDEELIHRDNLVLI